MKIGDKIRTIGYFSGIEGEVISMDLGYDIEDHGCIEIRVTKSSDSKFRVEIGELEHFVHFGWKEHLEVIK